MTAVLTDGWFQAHIETGDDQWDDWFTWVEENVDWRRASTGSLAKEGAEAQAKVFGEEGLGRWEATPCGSAPEQRWFRHVCCIRAAYPCSNSAGFPMGGG